ncbi:MAG: Nif11-like leader peptide family RiPP precursor [Clostridia bacterium]|nr:Nif11-like leader peptide family RiPP precursor [Clostridia bacterium]
MALENAKKFLEMVTADAALAERLKTMKPEEVTALAAERGFEASARELEQAARALRSAARPGSVELDPEDMDRVAGGIFWRGDAAPDGHEMACFLTYHNMDWSRENNIWCTSNHFWSGCSSNGHVSNGVPVEDEQKVIRVK